MTLSFFFTRRQFCYLIVIIGTTDARLVRCVFVLTENRTFLLSIRSVFNWCALHWYYIWPFAIQSTHFLCIVVRFSFVCVRSFAWNANNNSFLYWLHLIRINPFQRYQHVNTQQFHEINEENIKKRVLFDCDGIPNWEYERIFMEPHYKYTPFYTHKNPRHVAIWSQQLNEIMMQCPACQCKSLCSQFSIQVSRK